MTDKRYTAVLATLFDSAADATLDYAVSRHNIHKMVFLFLNAKNQLVDYQK